MRILIALLFLPVLAGAQDPQTSVSPAWDITQTLTDFAAQAERARPLLEQLNPQEWIKNGAPEAYLAQWQAAKQELGYVTSAAKTFERQPERLTAALETYFRWQALAERLGSLVDGARRYQSPALGDQLVSVVGENAYNRDRLRQFITDLANQREQEFSLADREAQRCRDNLNRQPAARTPAPAKRASPAPKPEVKP